jgi:hypothetical protein
MIRSTGEYNHTPVHNIILDSDSQYYQQSAQRPSRFFPGFSYHYEFWLPGDDNLYACIHCTHENPNQDLVDAIRRLLLRINTLMAANGITASNNNKLRGLSGSRSKINTYPINLLCRRHVVTGYEVFNAQLMRHLINATYNII